MYSLTYTLPWTEHMTSFVLCVFKNKKPAIGALISHNGMFIFTQYILQMTVDWSFTCTFKGLYKLLPILQCWPFDPSILPWWQVSRTGAVQVSILQCLIITWRVECKPSLWYIQTKTCVAGCSQCTLVGFSMQLLHVIASLCILTLEKNGWWF